MTQASPTARPTAADALERFQALVVKKSAFSLRRRLRGEEETLVRRFSLDMMDVMTQGMKYLLT